MNSVARHFVVIACPPAPAGRLRHPAGQPAAQGSGREHRVHVPDAAEALQEPGKPRHPRLFRRRHPRGRVLLRGSGVPAAHRGHDTEGQGPPARRRRRHHRRVGRQLHGAGLRPLRRQAVRRLRAALPQARRSGRAHRPRPQSGQLGQAVVDGLGPFRTGGRVLRRDPVQRRDLRRPRPRRRSVHHGVDHRHLAPAAGWSSTRTSSMCCARISMPCGCPARPPRRRRCRSCSPPSRSTTTAAPATSPPALGPAVHRAPRIRRGPPRARYAS